MGGRELSHGLKMALAPQQLTCCCYHFQGRPLHPPCPHLCPPHCCRLPAADSDVAFVNKPVWDSFLAFIEEVGADAAFQAEQHIGVAPMRHALNHARHARLAGVVRLACASFAPSPPLLPFHSVNIGSYVVLPTPASIRLYDAWAGSAVAAIRDKKQDQFFLPKLSHLFDLCNTRHSCLEKRKAQVSSRARWRGCLAAGERLSPQASPLA